MFRHGINCGGWWCNPGGFFLGPQGMGFFPGPLGTIITMLFWGVFLYLLIKGVQLLFSTGQRRSVKTDTAVELLRNRYAQGRISREEFQQIQKDLQ